MSWIEAQKKTYVRWINFHLATRNLHIDDLGTDLRDGTVLINLLEILTGKVIDKYYKNPKNRTYWIANHSILLSFLSRININVVNCSSQDLADGNMNIMMGTVWAIIRKFSLASGEKTSLSQHDLLLWCKSKIKGCDHISSSAPLDSSFSNGLAFCALLHAYDPTLIDYGSRWKETPKSNLELAFTVAEGKLGIPQLIDPADICAGRLDERSLITYLAEFYRVFSSQSEQKTVLSQSGSTAVLQTTSTGVTEIENVAASACHDDVDRSSIIRSDSGAGQQITQMRSDIAGLHQEMVTLSESVEAQPDQEAALQKEIKEQEFQNRESRTYLAADLHAMLLRSQEALEKTRSFRSRLAEFRKELEEEISPSDEKSNAALPDEAAEKLNRQYYDDDWWERKAMESINADLEHMLRVIKVQSIARGWLARRECARLRKAEQAATQIQRVFKGWMQRNLYKMLQDRKRFTPQIIRIQSVTRMFIAKRDYKMLKERTVVAKEILYTEKSYVSRLDVIVKVFIEPMRKEQLATKEQLRALFSEIEVILSYNTLLCNEIDKKMKNWHYGQMLGDTFAKMVDFLKVYTQYVNNYNSAMTLYTSLKRNDKFAGFLLACQKDPRCMGLDLPSFLILPIQRIPRYVLLLEDLHSHTPTKHADYHKLQTSMWKMKSVADYVNEKKRDAESVHEVLSLQDKISGRTEILAQPHRRYLREGVLLDVQAKMKLSVFLFNDLLIGTKKNHKAFVGSTTFKFVFQIDLNEHAEVAPAFYAKQSCFVVRNEKMSIHLAGLTDVDSESWIRDIKLAVDKIMLTSTVKQHRSSSIDAGALDVRRASFGGVDSDKPRAVRSESITVSK